MRKRKGEGETEVREQDEVRLLLHTHTHTHTFCMRAGMLVELVAKPMGKARAAGFPTNLAIYLSSSLTTSSVPTRDDKACYSQSTTRW